VGISLRQVYDLALKDMNAIEQRFVIFVRGHSTL
jgi:hypothetical protein